MYAKQNIDTLNLFVLNNPKILQVISNYRRKVVANQKFGTAVGRKVGNECEKRAFATPDFVRNRPKEADGVKAEDRSTRLGVESILPDICMPFLSQECVEQRCPRSHRFVSSENVYRKLSELGTEKSSQLFRVIVSRCQRLLLSYFETFMHFFAANRMVRDLSAMVPFCECPSLASRMADLLRALMSTGKSYCEAAVLMIRSQRCKAFNTLAAIFDKANHPEATPARISLVVKQLRRDPHFVFDKATIDFFLALCCELESQSIAAEMCRVLETVKDDNDEIVGQLEESIFVNFMEMIKAFE